jgi:hypothetical protein
VDDKDLSLPENNNLIPDGSFLTKEEKENELIPDQYKEGT